VIRTEHTDIDVVGHTARHLAAGTYCGPGPPIRPRPQSSNRCTLALSYARSAAAARRTTLSDPLARRLAVGIGLAFRLRSATPTPAHRPPAAPYPPLAGVGEIRSHSLSLAVSAPTL
jgi:hypothetical protein